MGKIIRTVLKGVQAESIQVYLHYVPQTALYPFPFSFRKVNEAALCWHMEEYRRGPAKQ